MKIELSEKEKLLVVAPHPDDESIGCGGLLNKFRGHCDVLLITDGVMNNYAQKELSEKRQKEFIDAVNSCGVNEYFMLHIPEKKIRDNFDKIISVDYSKYKYVFVPNKYEYHKDHIDTYTSIKKALKKKKASSELIEYEVWTTIRFPNIYLDITNYINQKTTAICCHKSQTDNLDYVKLASSLNAYRGLSKEYEYAEAYYCEAEKRRESIRRKKREIKKRLKGK